MASRKHHKQDSTRPTKARSRRMRESGTPQSDEYTMAETAGETERETKT